MGPHGHSATPLPCAEARAASQTQTWEPGWAPTVVCPGAAGSQPGRGPPLGEEGEALWVEWAVTGRLRGFLLSWCGSGVRGPGKRQGWEMQEGQHGGWRRSRWRYAKGWAAGSWAAAQAEPWQAGGPSAGAPGPACPFLSLPHCAGGGNEEAGEAPGLLPLLPRGLLVSAKVPRITKGPAQSIPAPSSAAKRGETAAPAGRPR